MIRLTSHRLSWPAMCAATAVLLGTGAGMATVGGLHPQSYGPTVVSSVFDNDAAMVSETGSQNDEGYGGYGSSAGCNQCSERERGYRWAVLATIRYPDQCPGDSWGFRRGCLDFVGGS